MTTVSRLYDQFKPTHYDLSLALQRTERTFTGTVTIRGIAANDTIILHSKQLDISSATIDGKAVSTSLGDNDEVTLFSDWLKPGRHTIVIAFSGAITDPMHGLYPSYFEHNGVKKELLATQFESHHAREVFPNIDEPEAKATFDLTLTTEQNVSVLGNQPVRWQRVENEQLVTAFETTPIMSSYLLAWVVGELHSVSATTASGVQVNVWSTPIHTQESLAFALQTAVDVIEFFESYFNTPYPLPKSDHVALPDFSSGAMENWGLITYREMALLVDPASSSISSKQYVATVVAHELAHQWFGNLVTMKWWNNLWLNESFANLMEYVAVDALHPEWNIWLEHSAQESTMALRRDAIDGVQPVQTDVRHPDEISTLFDGAIVYAKGGRLLRMLQQYVGDDAFRAGLQDYFARFAYQNTEADDLWQAIEASSGKAVTKLMDTWISQPGYPVVSVQQKGTTLTLKQTQFFIGPHEATQKLWPIPLLASTNDIPERLDKKQITTELTLKTIPRLNIGNAAHFITHYDEPLTNALIDELSQDRLTPLDRMQLLNESTLLTRGGYAPSASLIPFVQAYSNETSEPVWGIMSLALSELRKFVESDKSAEAALRTLSGTLARTQYERLGWEKQPGESEEDTKLRSLVISHILYSEDPDAIQQATEIYNSTPLHKIDPDIRSLVISNRARHGDAVVVDQLLAAYRSTHNVDLLQDITVGITSTRIQEKISELLDAIKDPAIIRPQDTFRWFVYLIRGRESRELAWQWLQNNWQWVIDTFSGDKSYDDFPRYAASGLVTRAQLDEFKVFFEPKKAIAALTRTITLGIAEIEGRVELIERDRADVIEALLRL